MAEPVGTTLGALGVAGLFSVCLDCFNLVEDGLSLGKDFVLLEDQFSALRIRLYAWGKACGFMSPGGYDKRLDHQAWRHHVQKQLNFVSLLFLDAGKLVKKYELLVRHEHQAHGSLSSANSQFIEEGMQQFLKRIKKTKKQAGTLGAFKWALKDKKKFTELIERLKACIEALELVCKDMDLFDNQRQIVEIEIETISDMDRLRAMISSQNGSGESDIVSSAASHRLLHGKDTIVDISMLSNHTGADPSTTFVTAPSHQDNHVLVCETDGDDTDGNETNRPLDSTENSEVEKRVSDFFHRRPQKHEQMGLYSCAGHIRFPTNIKPTHILRRISGIHFPVGS